MSYGSPYIRVTCDGCGCADEVELHTLASGDGYEGKESALAHAGWATDKQGEIRCPCCSEETIDQDSPPSPKARAVIWTDEAKRIVAGYLAGSLFVLLGGLLSPSYGPLVVGVLGYGTAGVFYLMSLGILWPAESRRLAKWYGAACCIGGLVGIALGIEHALQGRPFEWWTWPLGCLGGALLGGAVADRLLQGRRWKSRAGDTGEIHAEPAAAADRPRE